MSSKEDVSRQLFVELTTKLGSFSHEELLRKKIELIKNVPASEGVWRSQAIMLCGLIDNKITSDKLSQSAWKEWGQPIVIDILKIGVVSSITFASGYFLAKPASLASSQEPVSAFALPQKNAQPLVPSVTMSMPAKNP